MLSRGRQYASAEGISTLYGRRSRAVRLPIPALRRVKVERDHEGRSQLRERLCVQCAPTAAERRLRNREEVVAVHDALPRKRVAAPERDLGGKVADRSGHG